MLAQKRLLVTDTTMRDGHQSLLATRMRSYDMIRVAPAYAQHAAAALLVECWGGATFDVAYRFLQECPWQRLRDLRAAMPNLMTQMLLRASNGVGYTNYPDNVVEAFVGAGGEVGRRRVPRVRLAELGREHARRDGRGDRRRQGLRGGDLLHRRPLRPGPRRSTTSSTTSAWRKELRDAGAHVLGAQGHGGPAEARRRPRADQGAEGGGRPADPLPHPRHQRHRRGAAILAAAEAGVDAVDAAMDAFSGGTSQPCLGSIVEALRHTERDTGLDIEAIRADLGLLGGGARAVRRLRGRAEGAGLRGLSARDAGRAVHQPQGAGPLDGARGALARGRARCTPR